MDLGGAGHGVNNIRKINTHGNLGSHESQRVARRFGGKGGRTR